MQLFGVWIHTMVSAMPSPPSYKKSPCLGQEVHFHSSIIERTKRTKRTFPWAGKNIFSNCVRAYGYFCTVSSVFLLCHSLAPFVILFYNRGKRSSFLAPFPFLRSARRQPCGIFITSHIYFTTAFVNIQYFSRKTLDKLQISEYNKVT